MADKNASIEILQGALRVVDTLSADKSELEKCTANRDRCEKALNTLRKTIDQEKTKTVNSRRADIENGFKKKIKSLEDEISKLESRRAKARTAGVKSRVGQQTTGLKDEIAETKRQLAAFSKEKKLSFLCQTKTYYRFFFPGRLIDWLMILVILAAMIGALVLGFKLNDLKVFLGILAADVVILVIYAFLWSVTKGKHTNDVKIAKQYIDQIIADEKAIRNITKNIRNDKDDSQYDLGSFDAELAAKKQEVQEQEAQKSQALYQFDNITKQELLAEIDANNAERLNQLLTENAQAAETFAAASQKVAAAQNELNVNYVQYIGTRNMTHDSIKKMIALIESGDAVSISDAASKISG